MWTQPPRVYAALPADRRAVLAEFPFPQHEGAFWHDARYMYFSTFHWHRLLNGNSGFFPRSYKAMVEALRPFPSESALKALRDGGVEYLVLHAGFEHAPEYARVVEGLSAHPGVTLVTTDQYIAGEVRLYRLHQ